MQPFTHPRDLGLLGQPVLPLFINARDFASCWHANAGFWEIRFFKHIPFPGANTSITSKSIRNIRRRNTIFHTLPNTKGQFVHTVPFHPVSCGDMVFTKLSRGNPHCHQGRVCQQWTAFTRQFPYQFFFCYCNKNTGQKQLGRGKGWFRLSLPANNLVAADGWIFARICCNRILLISNFINLALSFGYFCEWLIGLAYPRRASSCSIILCFFSFLFY